MWCRSPLEGPSLRWVPSGMPRLSPEFKRCVFFLYGRDPKCGDGQIDDRPVGSGVLMGVPFRERPHLMAHVYAVTCWHVATDIGASIIRINTNDGKSRYLEFDPSEWQFNPRGSDLAAIDITSRVEYRGDEIACVPTCLLADDKFIEDDEVEIGEDGFMLGLFADQAGADKNLIAARFGNLSLLADASAPLRQPNGQRRPAHLFDLHSRPGFSGSPVFIYRTPGGDLRDAALRGGGLGSSRGSLPRIMTAVADQVVKNAMAGKKDPSSFNAAMPELRNNLFLRLLGIHVGQYHDKVKVGKAPASPKAEGGVIYEGDYLDIPNSMALVVPASEIQALLNLPTFKDQRMARDETRKQMRENAARPEAAVPDDRATRPEADANPDHREDFTRLVSAASKRKPAGDRT